MTCERVEEHLSALIDNELDPETRKEVLQHLDGCRACAQACRELKLLVETSAQLESVAPPDRLFLDIRRRMRNTRSRPWFAWKQAGWVLAPAAATVALMLVLLPRAPVREVVVPTVPEPRVAAVEPGSAEPVIAEPQTVSRPAVSRTKVRQPTPTPREFVLAADVRGPAVPVRTVSRAVPVQTVSDAQSASALRSLREVQQALEEIEAALHRNPGNPHVLNAYRAAYQKGEQLKDRYLVGAR
jgi:hypothetical protein